MSRSHFTRWSARYTLNWGGIMRLGSRSSAVLLSLCVAATPALAQEVPAPAFRVGDTWVYTLQDKFDRAMGVAKVTETVTTVSEKGIETSITGDPRDTHRRYTRELNVLRGLNMDFDPMVPNYSFPLTVGKRWEGKYSFPSPATGARLNTSQQGRVDGWEEIKVPAGTFKAVKITLTRDIEGVTPRGDRFSRRIAVTNWYAPEVRWSVRRETRSPSFQDELVELLEFKPGAQ
jgi:hypothetical protein